ncbi:sigma-70 family RNA polymerase sigma factor [Singulisphaera sp. PoT]|uniref:sigma-70 family RNA polymerase sigma factor n=1 Tax=Singulisphaera sp. PoT TaxID=3411797 RepID=UPI003BF4D399
MAGGEGKSKRRQSYRPAVEALEALRLLSIAAHALPELAVERDTIAPASTETHETSKVAWDYALGQTEIADLLGPSLQSADAQQISSGLTQLNRYLQRAWFRAGVPPQMHDDCTQAVFVTLLQNLGRTRFDALLGEIGQMGIRDVLSRETADGPDFFRAIDTVKKRAQRERAFQPLDGVVATASTPQDEAQDDRRGALHEVISQSLSPREAALIHATLKGETPAEIAQQWGVAPKTVSNEKTRVLQKLREALLVDDLG